MRATAAARAGHAFRDAGSPLKEGRFERVELIAKPLAPACRDGGQAAGRFERVPHIHTATYDTRID
jgi:hypothetical protein